MFVYEVGNALNLTFKGNLPVENPEVVLKGYENVGGISCGKDRNGLQHSRGC